MQTSLAGGEAKVSDTKEGKEYIAKMVHALWAPLIVWPGYEDDFKDKKQQVVMARLARLSASLEEKATDFEIALYMSSASFVNPLPPEGFDVFMYACRQSGFAASMNADEMLKDQGKQLDYQAKALYENLGHWLYKKQKEALKTKKEREPLAMTEIKSELIQATL